MKWIEYVSSVAQGDTQTVIGYKAGVSGATISRWSTSAPKPESVAAFARAYGRPVLEAFVAAGYITEAEAGERPVGRPDLTTLTNEDLLVEVARRLRTQTEYDLAASKPTTPIGFDQLEETT